MESVWFPLLQRFHDGTTRNVANETDVTLKNAADFALVSNVTRSASYSLLHDGVGDTFV